MTLNLSDKEMTTVEELAKKKGLNKTALLKQCLRVYQVIEKRIDRGERLYFQCDKGKRSELEVLCGKP